MSNNSHPPLIKNNILAALPVKEYKRLVPHLESVALQFNTIIYGDGDAIEYVYFPGDGLISLLAVMEDSALREVGLIGNEGMLGISAVLGMKTSPNRALVQMSGTAVRMKTKALRSELKLGGELQSLLFRYTHALFSQVSQSAACVSSHMVDKRLCRWLLMTHDRAPGDEFEMKHEFMAMMLGVTRPVVTRAAGALQQEKMIRYSRGKVTVLNRHRLETNTCQCYWSVKEEYDRSARHSNGNGRN